MYLESYRSKRKGPLELKTEKGRGNRPWGKKEGRGKARVCSQEGECTCIFILLIKKKNLEKLQFKPIIFKENSYLEGMITHT